MEKNVGDEDCSIFLFGLLPFMFEDCKGWTALVTATAASRLDAQLSSVLTYTTAF